MMKNATPLVCLLVLVIDAVAGILGIQAENSQNKVKHLKMWILECRDPSYQAFKLGLAAAVLLAFAHTISNLFGGCICIRSKEDYGKATANKQLSVASLILSWITLAIALPLLITGTLANSRSRKNCGISNHRVLEIGGLLCFFHGLFAIAYYVSAKATFKEEHRPKSHTNTPPPPA